MVRGFRRLIDDIRNPKASKKERKKKIDSVPDLPFFPGFKAPPILKVSKELAKIFVEIGPKGGNTRLFDEPAPIIARHTQEQLAYEAGPAAYATYQAGLIQPEMKTVTRKEENEIQRELQDMFDQLPTEGQQEAAYLDLRESNETGAQNQTLENALARMAADRPTQFQQQRSSPFSSQFSRLNLAAKPKKKKKVSAYSKRFGIELKKLKKLHPRTKISGLMKRAHRRTKAAMKKK